MSMDHFGKRFWTSFGPLKRIGHNAAISTGRYPWRNPWNRHGYRELREEVGLPARTRPNCRRKLRLAALSFATDTFAQIPIPYVLDKNKKVVLLKPLLPLRIFV